jgi:predicted CxxxxCH...CXXCH cytochrome family protein
VGPGLEVQNRARHVDGVVDVSVPQACDSCHGSTNPAPPVDTRGRTDATLPGVGAHQTHVLGTPRARAVACDECHRVPDAVLTAGHLDSALPAEVSFAGIATAFGNTPVYTDGVCADSYCHGGHFQREHESGGSLTAPNWTLVDGSQSACGSCHGLPPPLPHPQVSDCRYCHRNALDNQGGFSDPSLHVNGQAETYLE